MSLDLPSEAALAEERPDEFLRRYPLRWWSTRCSTRRAWTIVCRTRRPFPLRAGTTAIGIADLTTAIPPARSDE